MAIIKLIRSVDQEHVLSKSQFQLVEALPEGNLQSYDMQMSDVPAVHVMELENYPFPWTLGIFRDCLRHGYQCLCLTLDDELVGYAILQQIKDECHLLNLCVDHTVQGRGFGSRFLRHLMDEATQKGARSFFLEVRPSNARAVDLYANAGFHEIGRRPNYYEADGEREDAIVMAKELVG